MYFSIETSRNGVHHKHQPLPWIKSTLSRLPGRYCPLVIFRVSTQFLRVETQVMTHGKPRLRIGDFCSLRCYTLMAKEVQDSLRSERSGIDGGLWLVKKDGSGTWKQKRNPTVSHGPLEVWRFLLETHHF